MGNTTRNPIITERFSDPAQINASITKEATGTDFISAIRGDRKSPMRGYWQAAVPAKIPTAKAERNPRLIFPKEKPMVIQKSASWI